MTELVPRAPDVIRDATLYNLLPLWMDNLAENLPIIRRGLDAQDLPKRKEPAIVIGAGPSLTVYKHLNLIRRSGWKHTILACDKVLGDCVRRGIVPYAVATVDGSPRINAFYDRHDVKKHAPQINGVFNTLTHPSVINTWQKAGGQIYFFNSMLDDPGKGGKLSVKSLTNIMWLLTKQKGLISGIGNVGAFLWNIGVALEADPLILVGMDFSEQILNKAEAVYFDYYVKLFLQKYKDPNVAQDRAAAMHQPEVNPDFVAPFTKLPYYKKGENVHYIVNPIWKYYRDAFAMHIVSSGKKTINCTGNGCLTTEAIKCPNFTARPLMEVLKEYA